MNKEEVPSGQTEQAEEDEKPPQTMGLNIGLTYDLRESYLKRGFSLEETVELDSEITLCAIEKVIASCGHKVSRIGNVYELVGALSRGERWDLVFNIAEGMFGFSRESQVPGLLDAYRIPYTFSDASVLGLALDKEVAKFLMIDTGVNTAPYWMVYEPADIAKVPDKFPLFAKPNFEGSSKGIGPHSFIDSRQKLISSCEMLLEQFKQPVLVEEYLPHNEYTVGVLGTGKKAHVIGVMEIVVDSAEGYSYQNKINYKTAVQYRLASGDIAKRCADLALKSWRVLGGRDAGRIDIKLDKNFNPAFVEVNPLAGLNPEYSDLPILCRLSGMEYGDLIREILNSALERVKAGS